MKHITVGEYEYRYNDALNVIEFRGGPYNTTEWRESMYHPTKIRALHELLPNTHRPESP